MHNLSKALFLTSFELGVRFFHDYLEGNVYFNIISPEDNLFRAENQFQLSKIIMSRMNEISTIIEGFLYDS